jgi:hypothetical protein
VYTLDEKINRAKLALKNHLFAMTDNEYRESFLFEIQHDEYCDIDECICVEDCYVYTIFSRYTGDLVVMYEPMNSQYFSGYPMSIEDAFVFNYSPDAYDTLQYFRESMISEFNTFDIFQDEY